jgi:hypothetical protein
MVLLCETRSHYKSQDEHATKDLIERGDNKCYSVICVLWAIKAYWAMHVEWSKA